MFAREFNLGGVTVIGPQREGEGLMKVVKAIVVEEVPDVDTTPIEREKLVNVMVVGGLNSFLTYNTTGPLANSSFTLNAAFDWTLVLDDAGRITLVPLRKY